MKTIDFRLVICAVFVFILTLNFLYPLVGDDYLYLKKSAGLQSIIGQYNNWNARIYDLLYIGFLVRINPYIFDVFNAILGVIFILGFYALLFWDFKRKFGVNDAFYLAIMLCLLCVGCNFESIFLWASGSVNYLYGGVGVVLIAVYIKAFILNYKLDFLRKKIIIIAFLMLNLLTAMSHELWALFMMVSYIALFTVRITPPFRYFIK